MGVAPCTSPAACTTWFGSAPSSHSNATTSTCPPTVATQSEGKPSHADPGSAPARSIFRATATLPAAAAVHSARSRRCFAAASMSVSDTPGEADLGYRTEHSAGAVNALLRSASYRSRVWYGQSDKGAGRERDDDGDDDDDDLIL